MTKRERARVRISETGGRASAFGRGLGLFLVIGAVALAQSMTLGGIGTNDFVEYWSAYQLYSSGGNPYDATRLLEIQRAVGWSASDPLMMWNPPWILVLMGPLLDYPFLVSARLWLCAGTLLLFGSHWLVWATFSHKWNLFVVSSAATLAFYPVLSTLKLGQSSLIILFGTAGAVWALAKGRPVAGGLFVALISTKPQSMVLFLVFVLWWMIRERNLTLFLSLVGFTAALLLASVAQSPQALGHWLDAMVKQGQYAGQVAAISEWRTATVTSWLRGLSLAYTGSSAPFLMFAVPAAAILTTGVWLARRRVRPDWPWLIPPLLCWSLIVTPFAWVYDQSVLVIVQVVLVLHVVDRQGPASETARLLAPLVLLQLILLAMPPLGLGIHHYYFWVPIALLVIWHRTTAVTGIWSPK